LLGLLIGRDGWLVSLTRADPRFDSSNLQHFNAVGDPADLRAESA
jgi:hypothetical protein